MVSSREEIEKLDPSETIVHTSFRPSEKDIFLLVQKCPNLKAIQMSRSFFRVLSDTTRMFLSHCGIKILEGDLWGHRKDLHSYFNIEDDVVKEIRRLASKGRTSREIVRMIGEETKLSEGLVNLIIDSEKAMF